MKILTYTINKKGHFMSYDEDEEDCTIQFGEKVVTGFSCKLVTLGIISAIVLAFISIGYHIGRGL